MTANLGFASAVAEFGHAAARIEARAVGELRGGDRARARASAGTIREGYRAEFIKLAELASSLARMSTDAPK